MVFVYAVAVWFVIFLGVRIVLGWVAPPTVVAAIQQRAFKASLLVLQVIVVAISALLVFAMLRTLVGS